MNLAVYIDQDEIVRVSSTDPSLVGAEVTIVRDGVGATVRRISHEQHIEAYLKAREEAGEHAALFGVRAALLVLGSELIDLASDHSVGVDVLLDRLGNTTETFNAALADALGMRTGRPRPVAFRGLRDLHQAPPDDPEVR